MSCPSDNPNIQRTETRRDSQSENFEELMQRGMNQLNIAALSPALVIQPPPAQNLAPSYHHLMCYQQFLAAYQHTAASLNLDAYSLNHIVPMNSPMMMMLLANHMASSPASSELGLRLRQSVDLSSSSSSTLSGNSESSPIPAVSQNPVPSEKLNVILKSDLNSDSNFPKKLDATEIKKKVTKEPRPSERKKFERLTPFQLEILNKRFADTPRPFFAQREVIAAETGLTTLQVSDWCRNRRRYLRLKENEKKAAEDGK